MEFNQQYKKKRSVLSDMKAQELSKGTTGISNHRENRVIKSHFIAEKNANGDMTGNLLSGEILRQSNENISQG